MGFYVSEKRQALPEELLLIIDGLMQESSAMVQREIEGNEGRSSISFRVPKFRAS
jgi:hypothetical protein